LLSEFDDPKGRLMTRPRIRAIEQADGQKAQFQERLGRQRHS
jgi:hypothetical protein